MRNQIQRIIRNQIHRPTHRQRSKNLEHRKIERHRRRRQRTRQLLPREHPPRPRQHRHHLRMLDHHPLRTTRRTRRINHIGNIRRTPHRRHTIHTPTIREIRHRTQHQRNTRVPHHELDTLTRITRIHRHITRTRLQHTQQSNYQIHRPGQQHTHHITRPHTQTPQTPGQPIRTLLQLPVRQHLLPTTHRHTTTTQPINHPLHHTLDPTNHRTHQRHTHRQHAHPLTLTHRPHIHLGDSPARMVGQSVQDRGDPVRYEDCGGTLEQIGVEEQMPGDSTVAFLGLDHQVVGSGAERNRSRAHFQVGQFVTGRRPVDRKQHLEQRAAVTVRAYFPEQFLQGNPRVGADVVHQRPRRVQGLGESAVRGRTQAEREGVDEVPDDLRRVRVVAAGDGYADGDVVPVGELGEDDSKCCRKDRERGGCRVPRRTEQCLLRKGQRDRVTPEGLLRGAGPVGRQVGRGDTFQVGAPELQFLRRRLALPGSGFGVLDGCR